MEMFCSTLQASVAVGEESGEGGVVEEETGEVGGAALAKSPSVVEAISAAALRGIRLWAIPERVEKGYEIPIVILDDFNTPKLGSFKRLGMCIVVNATWLAYYWATQEGNKGKREELEKLILDWPMDFIRIKGATPEEVQDERSSNPNP